MRFLLLIVGCTSTQGHLWGWMLLGPRAAVPESAGGGCNRGRLCTGEGWNSSTSAQMPSLEDELARTDLRIDWRSPSSSL